MSEANMSSVLITGASSGIGKEVARQLALRREVEATFLAVRNEEKGLAAKSELEQATKRDIFQVVKLDISDLKSVRVALNSLPTRIDALVMNAGGLGGKTPNALTKEGVSQTYANNLLGHVELLEGMIRTGRLGKVAVLTGSEAARGIPLMMMKRPYLPNYSTADFLQLMAANAPSGRKFNAMNHYGEIKYIGAMWMAELAREHRDLRFITVSPGSTANTEVAASMPAPVQWFVRNIFNPFLGRLFGLVHSLQKGAKRIVDVLTDDRFTSGHFYGSKKWILVGQLIDQSVIWPNLSNRSYQQHAAEAVRRFA